MPRFQMGVVINPNHINKTARVQDGASGVNPLTRLDNGKLVRLIGDSQYGLCAVGTEIEGVLDVADDVAPHEGFNIGAVRDPISTRIEVVLDGLQGTPGTGAIPVGSYVVAGTPVPRGTALSAGPRVCLATAAANTLIFKWRVVALRGTSAVGQVAIIERVS